MNTITNNIIIIATATPDMEANTSSSNMTDDIACYLTHDPQVTQSYQIYLAATILFVATGLIGNTLSFIVFSSRAMLRFSSNVYLLILAVSDSCFLVSVFLSKVLTTLRCLYFSESSFDVVNHSSVICKVLQYCNDLFSDYSTCLILGFTVERYAAAYLPMAFKRTCTNRRARVVCAATFVFISLCIAPYHALFMGRHIDYNVCIVLLKHEEEFVVLYIVEVVLFRIVPVLAIAVLNVFIIAKVSRITRQRTRIASNEWKGAKGSEQDPMRLSGRRRGARTCCKGSKGDGIVVEDVIQSKELERKDEGLRDSAKQGQIEICSLEGIKLIQPSHLELELPKQMVSIQQDIEVSYGTEHHDVQNSELPEQSVKSETNEPKDFSQSERMTSPHPDDCNFDELEQLVCENAFETSHLDSELPEDSRSNQLEGLERDFAESHDSTTANQIEKRTETSQPDTEFTEPERIASEFAQPTKIGNEPIHAERPEPAEPQTLKPEVNSTNGNCDCANTRHVTTTSSTRGKMKGKKERKSGRNGREMNEIITEERKNGKTSDGKRDRRKKSGGGGGGVRRDGCGSGHQRDDRSLQMTVTLILVSTIHVIVFLPVLVHFIVWKLERSKVIGVSPAAMQIAQNHTRVLYIAGFAVNFFLYTVSGRMFREQLRDVLWRRRSSARSGN